MDVDVSTSVAGNKPQRIRRIQTVTLDYPLPSLVFCFLHFLCLMVFHNFLPVFC